MSYLVHLLSYFSRGDYMKKKQVVIIKKGVKAAKVAATTACCTSGPADT